MNWSNHVTIRSPTMDARDAQVDAIKAEKRAEGMRTLDEAYSYAGGVYVAVLVFGRVEG